MQNRLCRLQIDRELRHIRLRVGEHLCLGAAGDQPVDAADDQADGQVQQREQIGRNGGILGDGLGLVF